VKYTTLNLTITILKRSADVIEWYYNSFTDTTGTTNVYLNMLLCTLLGEDFLLNYCDGVLKCLPDVKTIISLRQQLCNKDNIKDDEGSEKIGK